MADWEQEYQRGRMKVVKDPHGPYILMIRDSADCWKEIAWSEQKGSFVNALKRMVEPLEDVTEHISG